MKNITYTLLRVLLVTLFVFAKVAWADDNNSEWREASTRVVMVMDEMLETLDELRAAEDDDIIAMKRADIVDMVNQVVDFSAMAKGVMGKYYRRASADQREAFTKEFTKSLESTYASAMINFKIDAYDLLHSPTDDNRKGREKVFTSVTSGNASFTVQYTLSNKTGTWKITNLVLDGINIGLAFRKQFAQAMQTHKNDINAVIASWNGV